ncbi:MAG: PAS domain-containing sensor histidine kinase, partial [Microcystaceae cyanobacterium]
KYWQSLRSQFLEKMRLAAKTGENISLMTRHDNDPIFVKILPLNSTLFAEQDRFGLIIVVLDLQEVNNNIGHYFFLSGAISFLGIIAIISIISVLIRQRVLLPLRKIQTLIVVNQHDQRVTPLKLRNDEIGFLGLILQQKLIELDSLNQGLDQRVIEQTQALKQTQNFLQSILDYLPVALFVKDVHSDRFGQFLFWNHYSEILFGVNSADAIGKTVFDIHPLEQAALFDQKDREAIVQKELIDIPEELIESNSLGQIYLHTRKIVLFDDQDQPQYLLGISENITSRKQAEHSLFELNQTLEAKVERRTQALQKSENRYRSLLEGASDALLITDLQGNLVEVNQAAMELFGYQRSKMLSLTIMNLHPIAELNRCLRNFQKTIKQGKIQILDTLIINSAGYSVPVDITASLIQYSDQTVVMSSFRDIRSQKQAIAEQSRLLHIIEVSLNEIYIFDTKNHQIQFVNQGAYTNLIYPKQELLGKYFYQLSQNLSQAEFLQLINPLREHLQDTLVWQTEHQRANGTVYPVTFHLQIIHYGQEELFLAIGQDITEQKQAEAEMAKALEQERELNQLKGRFIDVASHEFRTPLTIILSSAEFLVRYFPKLNDERKYHYLNQITQSVLHMRDMIEDVLVLSRLDANKVELKLSPVSIIPFCDKIINNLALEFQHSHQINLIFNQVTEQSPEVALDVRLVHPCLSNLLSNAIKYSPNSPKIELFVDIQSEYIIFKVCDRGIGIPAKDQPHIFDSFQRASNVENIEGTGLGLNIVKRYVELHQGQILLNSKINEGSEFTIILPRYQPLTI